MTTSDDGRSLFDLRQAGESVLTIDVARRRLAAAFGAAGIDSPTLDARLLVAAALGIDRAGIVRDPDRRIGTDAATIVEQFARRRLAREPVSRILGQRAFHGLDFHVGPSTLDPRPDTETLVDAALELARRGQSEGGRALRILDLGTGSGAIIIALLAALPEATGVATDISAEALGFAQRNARRHYVEDRLVLQRTSWLDGICGRFDLVVSNPPYIPSAEIAALAPEVRCYDPGPALDGGADGLEAYRALLTGVGAILAADGWLLLEIGAGQAESLARLAKMQPQWAAGCEMSTWPDLSGMTRCMAFRTRP